LNAQTLVFEYKNWKGVTSIRRIKPHGIWWGATEYHEKIQWLLSGYDYDKGGNRDFAMNGIIRFIKQENPPKLLELGSDPDYMFRLIGHALGFTLYDEQKKYLTDKNYVWKGSGQSGQTTAFCIRLVLSEGPPLKADKTSEFSDREGWSYTSYNRTYFLPMLRDIHSKLKGAGFRVRELSFN